MGMDHSAQIGLFGGTFDPPHVGHLALATEARDRLGLAEVVLMVANDPWQKSGDREVTPAIVRLEMTMAASAGHAGLQVSDLEIRRGGATYTIDTVTELAANGVGVTLIVGADTAASLPTWHRADELASMVTVGVAARDGRLPDLGPEWQVRTFDMPAVDVSSSEIRRRVRSGEPIDHLVPSGVASLIRTHGLYGFRR